MFKFILKAREGGEEHEGNAYIASNIFKTNKHFGIVFMKIFNWLLIIFNNLNSLINWFCYILNPMPLGIMAGAGGAQCKNHFGS